MHFSNKFLLFSLSLLFTISALAQKNQEILKGKITDASGTPLSGVNVSIKALKSGTVTNANGFFSLKVNASKTTYKVSFSYLGFKTLTRRVNFNNASTLNMEIQLEENTEALNDISVFSKGKIRQAREQAYAVNVIKAEELYNTNANLNTVLDRTAGVRVRQDGGLGSNFSFSLNGFSGRQVKFFLDGIPIDNFGSSLTLNNFPVNLAERLEVYKGVLPITLGSDALGGAVNIITRTNPNYLDVSYGYGSFNTHKANVNFAYTNPKNGFTARATAFYNFSNNDYKVDVKPINLETGQRMPEQEVERFHDDYESATAKVEVGVSNKAYADKLLFGFIASGNDRDIQTGVTMDQVFGARTAHSTAFIPTLKYYKTDLFTQGLDLKIYGAYNMAKNQFIDTTRVRYNWLQETVPTTSAELRRTQLENEDDEALLTSNLSYSFNKKHSISLNYLLTDFKRESSDVEDPDNITFLFPQKLRKQVLGFAYQANFNRFNGSVFGKYYNLKAASFEAVPNSTQEDDYRETSTNSNNFGFGAAATYFLFPKLQLKASFEHTYRLPEATELLGDGLFTRRNSDLEAESSNNFNFGTRYEIALTSQSVLNFNASYFFRKAKDFIRLDQALSQPVDRQYVNLGKVETNGFDAEVEYRWKKRLRIGGNLTYQRIIDKQKTLSSTNLGGTTTSKNLNYGYKIPNIPYLFGNLNIGYNLLPFHNQEKSHAKLDVSYSLNYVHEYFFTPQQLGENNQDNIPKQLSHDASISYHIKDGKFNISLEVRNITNEDLFDNYLLQKPGRSFFINLRYFLDKQVF